MAALVWRLPVRPGCVKTTPLDLHNYARGGSRAQHPAKGQAVNETA